MTTALRGWHAGEAAVQQKLGYLEAVADRWQLSENFMREQHRIFHTSNLPFIPVTTTDDAGRPWAALLAGANGQIGFVKSPDSNTLVARVRLWEGDPLLETCRVWLDPEKRIAANPERFLTAGIGIEFTTRRRNKFAGRIQAVKKLAELDYEILIHVEETLGNCPKYINIRNFTGHPRTRPSVICRNLSMKTSDRLPRQVIDFIKGSDTVFIGSIYNSEALTAAKFPSHAGMNSRGGLPGFIRVRPSDGKTVIIPDYSGNRFLMSLGNIEASRLAAMSFVCFETGSILYITGRAQVLIGQPAQEIMPRQACIVAMEATGFVYMKDTFPVRLAPGTVVEKSPYSPKVKYLADEPEALAVGSGSHKVQLTSAVQLSQDVAIFRFDVITAKTGIEKLKVRPGQAIVLDFMDWIGPPQYSHMADSAPGSINDDRIRTWTVSSAHEDSDVTYFEMTMREMKGGAVTGALFNLLSSAEANTWGSRVEIPGLHVADVVGVTGDFILTQNNVRTLWVAGGIGLTPFLSMFNALVGRGNHVCADVVLALAAKDADVFLRLTALSLHKISSNVKIRIDLFTSQEDVDTQMLKKMSNIRILVHKGRVTKSYWSDVADGREVFICGPGGFGDAVEEDLRAAGVAAAMINREGFY